MSTPLDWQPKVDMTIGEVKRAAMLGITRVVESRNRTPRFGYRPGDIWRAHIMGAMGEAVVRKYTGWPWPEGVNVFRSVPDVGECEVRWSGTPQPALKVRNDEYPSTRLILTTGDGAGEPFVIRGWAVREDAERKGSWLEDKYAPCWFLPHWELRPINELVEMVRQEGGAKAWAT